MASLTLLAVLAVLAPTLPPRFRGLLIWISAQTDKAAIYSDNPPTTLAEMLDDPTGDEIAYITDLSGNDNGFAAQLVSTNSAFWAQGPITASDAQGGPNSKPYIRNISAGLTYWFESDDGDGSVASFDYDDNFTVAFLARIRTGANVRCEFFPKTLRQRGLWFGAQSGRRTAVLYRVIRRRLRCTP